MTTAHGPDHAAPFWFTSPGAGDSLAWVALGCLVLALYGLVVLYASFDRWAEHRAHGTPLAKTIPTLLTIALLYEVFPLGHFSILLPLSAILVALMADWARFHVGEGQARTPAPRPHDTTATSPETAHD
ncbi:hypothetical protein [Roseovarius sp.]|mgnify:CR=1 FL=1|uniref:hypothetical protein n=1 Tax=Roseovarius sp. TaxID=1486281 RepID=UPI000C3E3D1B|nr:hypothetical protein [Roseovarius sp.]MAZ21562.1 hypothetical protein [Roseovarius sp.]